MRAAVAASTALVAAALVSSGCGSARPTSTENTLLHLGPKAIAIDEVEATLASAPLPPGAHSVRHVIAGLNQPFSITASPDRVVRTRWLTAPGSADGAISYLRDHPPRGMVDAGSGGSGDSSGTSIENVEFDGPGQLSLQYTLTPYHGGVAVRIDAITIWVPPRPAWSDIPSTAASVDVTVVRKNPQLHQGAPTVHRTLTGHALTALVRAVNRRGMQPNYGPRSCPADLGGEVWTDNLVFHAGGVAYRAVQAMSGCGYLSIESGQHRRAFLAGSIDAAVLRALGLSANYGGR